MVAAKIWGKPACPKGLRHTFGVASFQAAVPPHLVQRWLGHASLRTTAIYADLAGRDERAFASRMWHDWPAPTPRRTWVVVAVSIAAALLIAIVGARSVSAADKNDAVSVSRTPWEIAYGVALMTDNNIRGITISAHEPSPSVYFEPAYKLRTDFELYGGLSAASIDVPNRSPVQIVYYGGMRSTFGKMTLDLGASYIDYPGGGTFTGLGSPAACTNGAFFFGQCNTAKGNGGFFEAYDRSTVAVNSALSLVANLYYSPSWVNTGAFGTYASTTAKVIVPEPLLPKGIGGFVSGEIGHYWFGTTDAFYGVPAFPAGIPLPDYTTWNVGVGLTYKTMTLDLRYYDTDLTRANCNVLTGDHTASFGGLSAVSAINPSGLVSNWCGTAVIAKLSLDTSLSP